MLSLVVKPRRFALVLSKSRLSPQTLLPQLLNSLICVRYICDATFTLIYVTFRSVFLLSKSTCFCLICIKHNLQLCNIRPSIAFRKKTDETIWIAVSGNNSVRQQLRTHKLFAYLYGSTTYVLCRFLIFQHRLIFLFSLNFYFSLRHLSFNCFFI